MVSSGTYSRAGVWERVKMLTCHLVIVSLMLFSMRLLAGIVVINDQLLVSIHRKGGLNLIADRTGGNHPTFQQLSQALGPLGIRILPGRHSNQVVLVFFQEVQVGANPVAGIIITATGPDGSALDFNHQATFTVVGSSQPVLPGMITPDLPSFSLFNVLSQPQVIEQVSGVLSGSPPTANPIAVPHELIVNGNPAQVSGQLVQAMVFPGYLYFSVSDELALAYGDIPNPASVSLTTLTAEELKRVEELYKLSQMTWRPYLTYKARQLCNREYWRDAWHAWYSWGSSQDQYGKASRAQAMSRYQVSTWKCLRERIAELTQ